MKDFLFCVRNGNLLKGCANEICVKQILINQGIGVFENLGVTAVVRAKQLFFWIKDFSRLLDSYNHSASALDHFL